MLEWRLSLNGCQFPSFCLVHTSESVHMCNDRIRVMHVKGLNYVLGSRTFLATVCSSVGRSGLVRLARGFTALRRAWLNSTRLHSPNNLNIFFAWPFTPALQASTEFYKMHPDRPFRALISASDRRNVKRGRQYHPGPREWFSSGSQKIGEKKPIRAHHVLLQPPPFKCSSLPFWIRWRLARWIAGPTGCESGTGCALPCCPVATQTCQFVLSWLSKCHCVGHFLTHTI